MSETRKRWFHRCSTSSIAQLSVADHELDRVEFGVRIDGDLAGGPSIAVSWPKNAHGRSTLVAWSDHWDIFSETGALFAVLGETANGRKLVLPDEFCELLQAHGFNKIHI